MTDLPLICLITDFGLEDTYVGVMKSVILGRCDAQIVDLSHAVQPQNVRQAAYLVSTAQEYLPQGAIMLCVVDPGVGTDRAAMAVRSPHGYFIGPDNGWLSYILGDISGAPTNELPAGWRAVTLDFPEFRLHPVSSTFHGRDIFAPAAAALASGMQLERLGRPKATITVLNDLQPAVSKGVITGRVIHVDHFGNLITNILGSMLPESFVVAIGGQSLSGPAPSYQTGKGELIVLIGSSGRLEIAVPNGSAAGVTGFGIDEQVQVRANE